MNGVNPDGVVRGSGIFAGGWGADRAAVYGVPEDELGAFYAQRTPAQTRGPARARRDGGGSPRRRTTSATRPGCSSRSTAAWRLRSCAEDLVAAVSRASSPQSTSAHRAAAWWPAWSMVRASGSPSRPCTVSPTGPSITTAACAGPSRALYEEVLDGSGPAGGDASRRSNPSGSTPGASTTHCSTRPVPLLAEPISYRDDRTAKVVDAVHRRATPDDSWSINGLQFLPFTTLYQLEAERRGPLWDRAARLLLLPDLVAYWFTGTQRSERHQRLDDGLARRAPG